MRTPNNKAGDLTERIMARVSSKLPNIPTHEYNRTYEAVLDVLTEAFSTYSSKQGEK